MISFKPHVFSVLIFQANILLSQLCKEDNAKQTNESLLLVTCGICIYVYVYNKGKVSYIPLHIYPH